MSINLEPIINTNRSRRFNDIENKHHLIAKKVLKLPTEDAGLAHSIVRLENSQIGKKKIARRTPLFIQNVHDHDKWIIRYAMGNGGKVKHLMKEYISLDYDGINDLGINFNEDVQLSIKSASWWDITKWLWTFPDLNVKISFRLGLLGFALGIISFVDLLFAIL